MVHVEAFLAAEHVVPGPHGCADAEPVVGRGGLQVRVLERRLAEEPGVRHAVEGTAAGIGDPIRRHEPVQALGAVHRGFLEAHLARTRDVLGPLGHLVGPAPGLAEHGHQALAEHPTHGDPPALVEDAARDLAVHARCRRAPGP